MQASEHQDFEGVLGEMFAALDKPMTEQKVEVFWKGLQKMPFVILCRCRDLLLDDLSKDDAPKSFGVASVWALRRRLRASGPVDTKDTPPPEEWQGDTWDILSNDYLFKYIRIKTKDQPRRYSPDHTYSKSNHGIVPGPQGKVIAQILVEAKRKWASVMRETPPSKEDEMAMWQMCMGEAEERITALSVTA